MCGLKKNVLWYFIKKKVGYDGLVLLLFIVAFLIYPYQKWTFASFQE
jgi:hypothetical protein